jgi:uncharacterized protein YebE (UPF0316 family)
MDIRVLLGTDSHWWLILPVLVCVARILDVSLGTLRVVFVSRGQKYLAPIVGFFEVLIWIAAVAQVMHNLDNVYSYLAYATGFGIGTYVGLRIEERLALGTLILRIITRDDAGELVKDLRGRNFGVTCIDAEGSAGKVKIIFAVIRRGDLKRVLGSVQKHNPMAFYTVEDVRAISKGITPLTAATTPRSC